MENPWQSLKNDKEAALLQLYKNYYQELFNYGVRIARNEELTRDSIHDLFVHLWSKDSFEGISNPKPYLLKSLRYIIIDGLKEDSLMSGHIELPDVALSTEDIQINSEINEASSLKIKSALTKLTNRQKEVVYLRFYNGLDYAEIAEITGISNQSVRNLFSKAIRELRNQMLPIVVLSTLLHVLTN
ncbi:MAG: sigma-70 family RNA polymerase sigma factor [Cyclobacteriaceae bacterium]